MRALFLLSSLLVAAPALSTDDTDVDTGFEDTGTVEQGSEDLSGSTASERAGDEGGLSCTTVGGGLGALPLLLVGAALVRRRRD